MDVDSADRTSAEISKARQDGALRFSGWGLQDLPAELAQLVDLERLYLVHNELTELPRQIGNLRRLVELDVRNNHLRLLPIEIGRLGELRELYLDDNEIEVLPPEIGDLSCLRELDLDGNRLSRLPPEIGALKNLEELDLRNNRLTELPAEIGQLSNLRRLFLRGNRLKTLPPEIGRLGNLEKLELDNNLLTAVPRELGPLLQRSLTLHIEGNPLIEPFPELIGRGWEAVAAYLRSLEDAVAHYEAKVLLVGEGNVGKTSLLAALLDEQFVENRATTHGIEIRTLRLQHPKIDVPMTIRAWDFGGQEVYRITHQFFFSRRALYLLVWNARAGREQNDVENWLRRIRLRVGSESKVIVVATHCDERSPELDYPHLELSFGEMLVGNFDVDNRSSRRVPDLRDAITEEAAQLPQVGQMLSPRWIATREEIQDLAQNEPYISYSDFVEICHRHGVTGQEVTTLGELLHDLGQIIYYGDDEGLREIVVLNPEWLTKAIGYVLEDSTTRLSQGVLDHARLREIWERRTDGNSYPSRHHPYFLRLMEKFDICYRLDDDEHGSLVAQLVPHQRPTLPWDTRTPVEDGRRAVTLTCSLQDAAPGLIAWLTVRHHNASVGRHWRTGVFLRHPVVGYASEALLEMRGPRELLIHVRASSPDLFMNVLRDSIEHLIRRRWPGLGYEFLIPCPTITNGVPCTWQFPLAGLLRRREKGRNIQNCLRCDVDHDISELLTGFGAAESTLRSEIERLGEEIGEIAAGVTEVAEAVGRVELLATQSANSLRRIMKAIAVEVTDCPRLFTLLPGFNTGVQRLRFTVSNVKLTLWCEHPDSYHPWQLATYEIKSAREWLVRLAPYARLVLKALKLVVPIAGAVAGVEMSEQQLEHASRYLDLMNVLVEKMPEQVARGKSETAERGFSDGLTVAEGQALRALRMLLFESDPARAFGDLRRVQAPSGEFLWVCPQHYSLYDPGLPHIPAT